MKKQILLLVLMLQMVANAQVPTSFSSRGVGGGGALFSPSINPGNDNEYYVPCDMTELFHTTDFGSSYSQVHFNSLQVSGYSRVAFTNGPVRYSIDISNDMSRPFISKDGGTTWSVLAGNPDNTEQTYSIYADYNNPARVLISYYGAVYFSSDSGNTFSNIHTSAYMGAGIVVGGAFFDGANIYVGTYDGILISTNGGNSFNILPNTGFAANDRLWSFAAAKQNGTVRFFCLTGTVGNVYVGLQGYDYWGFLSGVYKMDYGSTNWTPVMNGININTDFLMYAAMAENDTSTCYLGGSNSAGEPNVMKTINGGASWTQQFNTTNNQNIATGWSGFNGDRGWSYGECILGMAVAPNNSNKVIFTDFGFVHVTSNGGANWRQAYVAAADENPSNVATPKGKAYSSSGIENTTCWQVLWSDSLNMFSAFSDIKGCRSIDGGKKWSFNYTGNDANSMYRIVKNPTNGTLYAGTSSIHDMYQSTRLQDATLDASDAYGKIIYSTNNGASWTQLHAFGHPVFWIALDQNTINRAYASVVHYGNGTGVGGIYVCNDLQNLAASTWTKLTNPPRTQGHPASIVVLNDGKVVCTYSGRRTSAGAFTNSSGVFIYNPTTNLWTDVSASGMYYWTKDIIVDPSDTTQNTWFVGVFSGWGGPPNGLGGLYRTTNRGTTWTKINALDRITSVTFNPANKNMIYMTTEQDGLWYSTNIHNATPIFKQVTSYPFRQPERVFFNPYKTSEVWVSSFGNGMRVGTYCGTLTAIINATGATTFCKPGSVILNANTGSGLKYQWKKGVNILAGANAATYAATTTGNYSCVVTTATGCSKISNKIQVTAQNCKMKSTVSELENKISINPNPSSSICFINCDFELAIQLKVQLYDVNGKQINVEFKTTDESNIEMNLENLNDGIYFLQVLNGEEVYSAKLILIK